MIATALALFVLAADAPPAADHAMPAPAADATKPVPLFTDLGTFHRPISSKNAAAQKYFDQGMRLLYGFNHDEAERAFREAARLDPSCAICWWGVAIVLGPNINLPIDPDRNAKAVEAVVKAKGLAVKASPVERELILALMNRYTADPSADRAKLDQAYADAMRAVHAKFPKDDDVAVLFAESMMDLRPWHFWDLDGKPAEGTLEIVATLEEVLKRSPDHPGANHYYIHATEASPNPGRATASAKRLETLIPGAGHLVHMPAHVYMRTGDYAGASRANAIGAKVDEKYIQTNKVEGIYPLMYYGHNLQFLAVSAGMEGNAKVSLDAARRMGALVAPVEKDIPMVEFVVHLPFCMPLRFGRWDEALAVGPPLPELPTATALWHWARAYALYSQKKNEEAAKEKTAFEAARAAVPPDAMMNLNTSKSVLDVATAMLDARIASLRGDADAAIAAWTKAVNVQDEMAYDEPPIWYYPVRESLGGELLRAGKNAEAEAVFRKDLEKNPSNGRSLFGLAESLKRQKKDAEAAAAATQFKQAWRGADVTLTVAEL
ncbi:MAG TPA: tetratricopeptide repeat protein [Candidatus Polarisedimenticolaceae bacterium]|nr:tetratricopeptide repeat protein [Candidatus Polarisedimenticolaceae bacterium]